MFDINHVYFYQMLTAVNELNIMSEAAHDKQLKCGKTIYYFQKEKSIALNVSTVNHHTGKKRYLFC